MQKKWKQTSVALLIAGLAVTGTSYALADEKENEAIEVTQHEKELTTDLVIESTETVQLPVVEKVETDKVVEEKATEEKVTEDKEGKEKVLPEVPEKLIRQMRLQKTKINLIHLKGTLV